MKNYEKEAMRTEPTDLESIKNRLDDDTLKILNDSISELIHLNEKMDALKKYIYYGKNANVIETKKKVKISNEYLRSDEGVRVLHSILGLTTEVGELFESVVKVDDDNKKIDEVNVLEEAGDLFWYLAILSNVFGKDFSSIQKTNIEKLKKRYPNKFVESDAINRNLEAERDILNKI